MNEQERKELEELRAYKAQIEAENKKPEPQPIEKIVMEQYNAGRPIVDIARINKLTVEEVLVITGNQELLHVSVIGDQVDPDVIGNQGTYNPGQTYRVPYTLN